MMNMDASIYNKLYTKLSDCSHQSDGLESSVAVKVEDLENFKVEGLENVKVEELEDKVKTIEKDLLFPCDQCDFESLIKKELVSHKVSLHKRLLCEKCDFKTNFIGYLRTHKERHHGSKKGQWSQLLKCPSCEFETKSAQYLNIHVQSKHNNQTRYRCSLCEYNTSTFEDRVLNYIRKSNIQMNSTRL